MLETLAVFPGTFDPITLGHLDIIKRASRIFSKVLVAVAQSPSKHTLFSLEERLQLVQKACAQQHNVTAKAFTGMLVDFLKEPTPRLVNSLNSSSCFHLVDFTPEFDYFLPSTPLG